MVNWIKNFRRKLRGLLEDRVDGVRGRVLIARKLRHLGQAGKLLQHEPHVLKRRLIGAHFLSSSTSDGTSWKRSPTTPKSATWKIGASSSLLIATITRLSFMPARCWIAPEMPTAT